ncbi:MAG: tetratricopeptide repeat protein, partial [Myxococcota bacterium]
MGSRVEEAVAQAKAELREGRAPEAVKICRSALLAQPDASRLRLLLGQALVAAGRYAEVRMEMATLLRRDPEFPPAFRVRGEAFLREGRTTEALESLQEALRLDPNDEEAEALLAEASPPDPTAFGGGPTPETGLRRDATIVGIPRAEEEDAASLRPRLGRPPDAPLRRGVTLIGTGEVELPDVTEAPDDAADPLVRSGTMRWPPEAGDATPETPSLAMPDVLDEPTPMTGAPSMSPFEVDEGPTAPWPSMIDEPAASTPHPALAEPPTGAGSRPGVPAGFAPSAAP